MTQDEIIEMAEQSNLLGVIDSFHYDTKNWVEEAMAFAKLVAAKEREFWMEQGKVDVEEAIRDEREACAKVCIEHGKVWGERMLLGFQATLNDAAEAIRARGAATSRGEA
jgi:hypothetical protein